MTNNVNLPGERVALLSNLMILLCVAAIANQAEAEELPRDPRLFGIWAGSAGTYVFSTDGTGSVAGVMCSAKFTWTTTGKQELKVTYRGPAECGSREYAQTRPALTSDTVSYTVDAASLIIRSSSSPAGSSFSKVVAPGFEPLAVDPSVTAEACKARFDAVRSRCEAQPSVSVLGNEVTRSMPRSAIEQLCISEGVAQIGCKPPRLNPGSVDCDAIEKLAVAECAMEAGPPGIPKETHALMCVLGKKVRAGCKR
jgi:hypothetical protein